MSRIVQSTFNTLLTRRSRKHQNMFLLLLITALTVVSGLDEPSSQPEHVHISFGTDTSNIVVTWTTEDKVEESIVEYGESGLTETVNGNTKLFTDGGEEKRSWYTHRVELKNLKPNTTYRYHCGSNQGWSAVFYFHTPPSGNNWAPRLGIYGDMGYVNGQSIPSLQQEAQQGNFDAILHVGDLGYDMYENNGRLGDYFMKRIEPIAAYVPYMTVAGNHENTYNFSNYRGRFSMPGENEGLWYSFNLGPVHFIGIQTEVYYFENHYSVDSIAAQANWLGMDLMEANRNRDKQPWIVVYGHRPMYCSSIDGQDCKYVDCKLRVDLEELLYNQGADLLIWAHEHNYERIWPVYNYKLYNGSAEDPYKNPNAPVHIITGAAGNREFLDTFVDEIHEWSAVRITDYSYTRMTVYNATHLYMEQYSVTKNEVVDSAWIVQTQHGPFPHV